MNKERGEGRKREMRGDEGRRVGGGEQRGEERRKRG